MKERGRKRDVIEETKKRVAMGRTDVRVENQSDEWRQKSLKRERVGENV